MRSDLEKIKGLQEIKTDHTKLEATFKTAIPQADLKKQIDVYAKDNKHMKDWSFMEAKKEKKETT